ncbi:MAG: DUF4276 family protein [Bryobacteraceae bacterium]
MPLNIASIVEGHGEIAALPIVIRRILAEANRTVAVNPCKPIRQTRDRLLRAGELEKAVGLAARTIARQGAILIVLDSEGYAPCQLGPTLLARARKAEPAVPIRVILAHCEWEAWYLAAASSLGGYRGLNNPLTAPGDPEAIRGAKEWLRKNMAPGKTYSEAIDQPAFAAKFDLKAARAAPSFSKLCRDVLSLLD